MTSHINLSYSSVTHSGSFSSSSGAPRVLRALLACPPAHAAAHFAAAHLVAAHFAAAHLVAAHFAAAHLVAAHFAAAHPLVSVVIGCDVVEGAGAGLLDGAVGLRAVLSGYLCSLSFHRVRRYVVLATVASATLLGAEGRPVTVEVHVANGLPAFSIVGLPDAACREARDRVRAALLSSGLTWPMRRVTVNLAPSDLRKVGAGLDLAIAVGLLTATAVVDDRAINGCAFVGELGLDGSLRSVPGVLALVDAVQGGACVVPAAALAEARLVISRRVLGARSLSEVVDALVGRGDWCTLASSRGPKGGGASRVGSSGVGSSRIGSSDLGAASTDSSSDTDLADVHGQLVARRAVEVAAAGGHHLLLVGPPGAGKTMLARCLAGLLPPLTRAESLETTKVHSAAGVRMPSSGFIERAPFRAPHHASSAVALLGGGTAWMRPGEVSLATNGVLFLDELGEFPPSVLEMLRQPLEDGSVLIARARATVRLPARFLLAAASNPCPCGLGSSWGGCTCAPGVRDRYVRRLSAPLLDRFDLLVNVDRPLPDELLGSAPSESSAAVALRVARARARARARGTRCNADLPAADLEEEAPLSPEAHKLLLARLRSGSLSARGLDRVRRVARTLADLDEAEGRLSAEHVAVALELRAARVTLVGGRAA